MSACVRGEGVSESTPFLQSVSRLLEDPYFLGVFPMVMPQWKMYRFGIILWLSDGTMTSTAYPRFRKEVAAANRAGSGGGLVELWFAVGAISSFL